jgi:NAD(P)H-hydrate epimerase
LRSRFGGVVLLKGRCTLVDQEGRLPYVIDAGNPGMATAGMGDVLTGLVAGVIAQRHQSELLQATACAAWIHGHAADDAALKGERGLIAGDLFAQIRPWLNPPR